MVTGIPSDVPPESRPDAALAALDGSTEALVATASGFSDADVRAPSLLPGWTRGHVLTHLARNADAMLNLVAYARDGQERPLYVSRESRDADIEAGAARPAAEMQADLSAAAQRLRSALGELTEEQWSTPIQWGPTRRPARADVIPVLRRTEVEVHHVDLDADYTLAHLPDDFVAVMLDEVTAELGARSQTPGMVLVSTDSRRWTVGGGGPEISGPPASLLGWLLGRTDGTGLHSDASLPSLERWR